LKINAVLLSHDIL
jgi:serine/threonine protein phosphatase PrpC